MIEAGSGQVWLLEVGQELHVRSLDENAGKALLCEERLPGHVQAVEGSGVGTDLCGQIERAWRQECGGNEERREGRLGRLEGEVQRLEEIRQHVSLEPGAAIEREVDAEVRAGGQVRAGDMEIDRAGDRRAHQAAARVGREDAGRRRRRQWHGGARDHLSSIRDIDGELVGKEHVCRAGGVAEEVGLAGVARIVEAPGAAPDHAGPGPERGHGDHPGVTTTKRNA